MKFTNYLWHLLNGLDIIESAGSAILRPKPLPQAEGLEHTVLKKCGFFNPKQKCPGDSLCIKQIRKRIKKIKKFEFVLFYNLFTVLFCWS
jgi:hypothetical protein